MVAATPLYEHEEPWQRRGGEQRVLLADVPWETYVALRDTNDSPGLRMTYLDGALEIMSPLPDHEDAKTTIGRLLELYAIERDVRLYGYGNTTFRNAAKKGGLEPDECYCVGHKLDGVPDIAIEVVLTSGGIDKLAVYARLGVREVWFWEDDALSIHLLRGKDYEVVSISEALPGLDLEALARFVRVPDQHDAVKAYRDHLRAAHDAQR